MGRWLLTTSRGVVGLPAMSAMSYNTWARLQPCSGWRFISRPRSPSGRARGIAVQARPWTASPNANICEHAQRWRGARYKFFQVAGTLAFLNIQPAHQQAPISGFLRFAPPSHGSAAGSLFTVPRNHQSFWRENVKISSGWRSRHLPQMVGLSGDWLYL